MNKREESKTEAVAEFLACGGKITKVEPGAEPVTDNFVGPAKKSLKIMVKEDFRDGMSPNLRWIGGRNG